MKRRELEAKKENAAAIQLQKMQRGKAARARMESQRKR
eukprot:Stramenopile-MAST_4_protein_6993